MMDKAVFFDLDGTLVSTEFEHRKILLESVLSVFDKTCSDADIDKFWFENNRNYLIKNSFDVDCDLFWSEYLKKDTVELRRQFARPYDDVDFLADLKKDYSLIILSAAKDDILDLQVKMIEDFIGCHDIFHFKACSGVASKILPKPNPDFVVNYLIQNNISKQDAFFVGNGEEDMITAKNAGICSILIDRNEYPNLSKEYDFKIRKLYELRDIL